MAHPSRRGCSEIRTKRCDASAALPVVILWSTLGGSDGWVLFELQETKHTTEGILSDEAPP